MTGDWFERGRAAFAAGLMCASYIDPEVRAAIRDLPVGGGAVTIMREWTDGWAAANMEEPE